MELSTNIRYSAKYIFHFGKKIEKCAMGSLKLNPKKLGMWLSYAFQGAKTKRELYAQ